MEYMQQIMEQPQPQETSGNSLRKSNSVELRAGKLYPTCDCIKRNGLQNECRRSECQGKTNCMKKSGPTCGPSSYATRLSNHRMAAGAGARQRTTLREVPIQKVGESHPVTGSEIPITNGTDLSEFKEIDPKLLSQMYQPMAAQPYSQFNPASMMGQQMPAFDQSFNGMQMGQPISNQLMPTSQPQAMNTQTFIDSSKAASPMANQNMFSMQPTISDLPPNFANKMQTSMPSPIAAIEPMPSIQPLPTANSFSPAGMQMLQNNQTQPSGIPGQFAPYMGSMNAMNPYSPNIASYLPYTTANLTSMAAGIPCGPAQ